MLETIREFALERLAASGEAGSVRHRHAAFFVALAERGMPAVGLPGSLARLAILEREDPNLRAALAWAVEQRDAETGLRLVTALDGAWGAGGRLREVRTWTERVLALGGDEVPGLRVLARAQLGFAALFLGDEPAAAAAGEQSLAESRARGDTIGAAYALNLLGAVVMDRGNHEQAHELAAEALVLGRQVGDPAVTAWSLANLGLNAALRGDHDRAVAWYEESLAVWRELGEAAGQANLLTNLAWLVRQQGDTRRAAALNREALATAWEFRNLGGLCVLLGDAAGVALAAGQADRSARLLGAADTLRERAGTPVLTMEQADYDRVLLATRAALGEAAFRAAWIEGEQLPLVEVVGEAEATFAEEEQAEPSEAAPLPPASGPVARSGLSPREIEVVRLIAKGNSNQDIADTLFISHRTATTHVRNILTKLDLDNRAAVAAWATRHHLA